MSDIRWLPTHEWLTRKKELTPDWAYNSQCVVFPGWIDVDMYEEAEELKRLCPAEKCDD